MLLADVAGIHLLQMMNIRYADKSNTAKLYYALLCVSVKLLVYETQQYLQNKLQNFHEG